MHKKFSPTRLTTRCFAKVGHHLGLAIRAIGFVCAVASPVASPVAAQDDNRANNLLEFFAGQGCAIGPATRSAAIAAGFKAEEISLLAQTVRKDSGAVVTGDWLVLSPSICKIRIPALNSRIRMTDPEVIENISAPDAYAAEGNPGCFLDIALIKRVQQTRNWDQETAFLEYMRFLAASLISGDLAFYSDSPLRTPYGFIATTGKCADIALMPEIKRNHALMIKHFDAFIRAGALNVSCELGESIMPTDIYGLANTLTDGKSTNAWMGLEYQIIAMGAGWFEGMSYAGKGTPRPPLCHYK